MSGTEFILYAHYSTHDWLTEKFEEFKRKTSGEFGDICFKLKIEDSNLREGVKPSIWMPETSLWIDLYEDAGNPTLIKDELLIVFQPQESHLVLYMEKICRSYHKWNQ